MKHTPFGKVKAKTLLYLRETTGKGRDLQQDKYGNRNRKNRDATVKISPNPNIQII